MKLVKKIAAMTLAAVTASSLLTGCGANNGVSNQSGVETEINRNNGESAGTGEVQKPESIRWMVHSGLIEENGTAQWAEEYERITGIKMNLDVVSNNEYTTILELAFASNTVPDVFDLNGETLSVYTKQGAVADLTDLAKNSEFYDLVDPELWEAVSMDGRIYGIPWEIPSGGVTYIRKDWLDRLDLEIPTTYEEYISMLQAFKDEIPECTVPVTAALKTTITSMNLAEFFQGATPEFIKKNGVWVDGMSEDNMEPALVNLRDAYAKGLLDTEVFTNTTSNCRDQWYAGSVGVMNYWAGSWGDILTTRLKLNIPEAEVVVIPPIKGTIYEFRAPSVLCISANLSEEKIASIFKYMFEFMNDGGEGQVLFQSGVEDLHWKQEGNKLIPLPTLDNPDEVIQKVWSAPYLSIRPLKVTDKELDLEPMIVDSLDIMNEYGQQKYMYPVSAAFTKIKSDLTLLRQEVIAKVVMGDMTVEEGIKKYKSESEMLNITKVLEEMNAQ